MQMCKQRSHARARMPLDRPLERIAWAISASAGHLALEDFAKQLGSSDVLKPWNQNPTGRRSKRKHAPQSESEQALHRRLAVGSIALIRCECHESVCLR